MKKLEKKSSEWMCENSLFSQCETNNSQVKDFMAWEIEKIKFHEYKFFEYRKKQRLDEL